MLCCLRWNKNKITQKIAVQTPKLFLMWFESNTCHTWYLLSIICHHILLLLLCLVRKNIKKQSKTKQNITNITRTTFIFCVLWLLAMKYKKQVKNCSVDTKSVLMCGLKARVLILDHFYFLWSLIVVSLFPSLFVIFFCFYCFCCCWCFWMCCIHK